jgi:hypothetical protein
MRKGVFLVSLLSSFFLVVSCSAGELLASAVAFIVEASLFFHLSGSSAPQKAIP